ncbi:MAG: hypothetical protein CMJ88_05830 [Planctomycetes bacterium]|nr:hypothetical protein [Planctomycetota bacterium]
MDEDWRALELATVVLEGLRTRRRDEKESASRRDPLVLNTVEIADAVQHLLVVTGQPAAAVSYGAVQAERGRRRQSVATMAAPAGGLDPARASTDASDRLGGRWAGEG